MLAEATIAAEDVRFRSHLGLDPLAIARAAWRGLRARRILEGGSTITQQVAKLLLARETNGRVAHGWLAGAVSGHRASPGTSAHQRPDSALYLNLAPYGESGDRGRARAAEAYVGHAMTTLTPAEAAFLARAPQQPTRYNPWRDPTAARVRASRILETMAARRWLSEADLTVARRERVALTREGDLGRRAALCHLRLERTGRPARAAD